ncbi:MAG: serine/threonine protein kinase [Phycisphaeraceae bacterium]|nr:serine/threonine protein kinase [Phycisphaeraceae bacterium]
MSQTLGMADLEHERDPGKTVPLAGASGPTPSQPVPSVEQLERQFEQAAKEGTNLDTLIGRLVIDTGLATNEEVQHCIEKSRAAEAGHRSLAQALVDNDFVTRRQIARLKQIVEAERSSQTIPGYRLLGKLGAGAMATVFKAKQLSLDREVAIKILPRKFSQNPQFVERFYAEGRAAAALNHPNIVQAYDVGKAGEYHYFVMEYVDGRTVYDDIVKHKRYSESEAVEIAIQSAEALLHAHARGLIHRDIKPKNIMINRDGVVKVADLGLARAITDKEAAEAESGKAFGTPYYISPEQIRGELTVGPPADIYSLGATLYHMLTGNVPFDGKNPSSVMHKHLKSDLVPPDHVNAKLSAGVSEVIEMMMAKQPSNRYQNCKDLLVDLRAVRAGEIPPLAHRETFDAAALASVAEAEASAPAELKVVETERRQGGALQDPLFIALLATLGLSVVANIILLLTRGG